METMPVLGLDGSPRYKNKKNAMEEYGVSKEICFLGKIEENP